MRKLQVFIHSLLLATTPSLLVYPQNISLKVSCAVQPDENQGRNLLFFDKVLRLLDELESGELEKKCNREELKKFQYLLAFLAKKGALPDHSEASLSLDIDIDALLNEEDELDEYIFSSTAATAYEYMIAPSLLNGQYEIILCRSWASKQWSNAKKFCKKHKKEILIGLAATAAAATVVGLVIVASSGAAGAAVATAAGAAGAAASSDSGKKDKKDEPPVSSAWEDMTPLIVAAQQAPGLTSVMDQQASAFKDQIIKGEFFQSQNGDSYHQQLPWHDNARALGSLFTHDSFNNIQHEIASQPGLALEAEHFGSNYRFSTQREPSIPAHQEIDRNFSTDYSHFYTNSGQEVDFNALSHQVLGEKALEYGYYHQAVQDFGKAIETNPTNPLPYLERGVAHFGMGEYDRSLEDYQQFTNHSQKTNPFSVPEFSLGFAKGLPQGIYESGRGMVTFLRDVVVHPIHTSQQMWDACTQLYNLGRAGEWDTLREVLAPEVYQLIREWDTISNDQRGKQGGYIFGKYGTDIFVPGTIVKAFSKTVKGAQEFSQVYKRLQTAEQTLLLESASALESAEKVAEVIRTNQTMVALGEEVGLTAAEMIQLQHAGKLQGAIDGAFESLINKPGYEVLKSAINEEKHVKFIRDYFDKSAKELQKSIKSFEKLIVEHKDKIANPSKFIPDWEALHPERKNALVNKKWPAEIQCYTEQRDILQTILNQRIEN